MNITVNNKKKILYCITKANLGGAQKYVYDLATSLNPDLYDVAVLVGTNGSLVTRLRDKGVKVIILGEMSRDVSVFKDIISFFKIIKIFYRERPDIVHLNSSKMGLLGVLAARLINFFSYLTSHTSHLTPIFTGHGWAFNEDRSALQKKLIFLLHKLTILLAHKTIAVSEQTKEQMLGGNILNRKMVMIRNGVGEIDFFDRKIARGKILEKINQGDTFQSQGVTLINRLWLGTISELHKNKGLKYLIEAVHLLNLEIEDKNKMPVVIIIGDGERKEKLQERINRYNLQDTVFMIGRVDEAEKYLKAFDIFSLTSITEALPYVLLEAGQAGLPIMASEVGGIPEIIDNMQTGMLVRPKEPEEIKKAIDFIIKNPAKADFFSQNIKNKIKEHFNKATMVRKTVEIYAIM